MIRMNENEVTAQKIDQIVNVLKPQVFKELDGRKAKMRHETEYDDSKWNCKVFEGLDNCRFHYDNKSTLLGELYLYHPFRLENYEIGSSEYEIVESMRYENETVKKSVMETLLRELDLCQYFEHKKLKGYADFFNSSSSFCCGVI